MLCTKPLSGLHAACLTSVLTMLNSGGRIECFDSLY